MYKTDFACTYQLHENCDQEDMYRIQLLQAFGIERWDDVKVENIMNNLYISLKENGDIKNIIDVAKKSESLKLMITLLGCDDNDVFKLLFKYELFDITHKCVCDILNFNTISRENKNMVIERLNSC